MTLLTSLTDEKTWAAYLEYKLASGFAKIIDERRLRNFVQNQGYLEVDLQPNRFSIPKKHIVKRAGSRKKRVVYSFSHQENYVLKLLTHLLIRKYDHLFAPNLYSYRCGHDIGRALAYFKRDRNLQSRYVYKLDIHDYFNSIDIDKMLTVLSEALADDPETYAFIASLLSNPHVIDVDGKLVAERKGVMAGVPIAVFLSNLYLNHIDHYFLENRYRYARYADDILLIADTEDQVKHLADKLKAQLGDCGLEINPDKEHLFRPGEAWTFLGVKYEDGRYDVSDESRQKLYIRMRKTYRRLDYRKNHKGLSPEKAAKALISTMNRKYFKPFGNSELTWTRWYFRAITTNVTLRRLDRYLQDAVRCLYTGTRTKRRFNCRYTDLKSLGYRSLVNEFHKYKAAVAEKEKAERREG